MVAATQNSTALSRFSRLGLGLGLKSSSASTNRARGNQKQGAEDEWYIPYSGPYEPPREPFRRRKERDSWGDPIDGENDADADDTAMASIELHKRYVVGSNAQAGEGQWNGRGSNDRAATAGDQDSSRAGHRDRAQSGVSGRTVSSGLVDPSRTSMASQRRSTVSSAQRPPVPSYINLDAIGGVGESPVPPTHKRNSSKESNRTSMAGLFTFGGHPRGKPHPDSGAKKLFSRKLSRSGRPSTGMGSGIGPTTAVHRRSSSTGSNSVLGRSNTLPGGNHNGADATDNDDYYNSYYFSTRASQNPAPANAAGQPTHSYQSASSVSPPAGKTTPSPTSSTRHPYAYVFPTSQFDGGPRTAPLLSSSSHTNPPSSGSVNVDPPRLTFTEPPPPLQKPASANVAQSQFSLSFPFQKGFKQLKNSASTPDLRLRASTLTNPPLNRPNAHSPKASPTFKPKDRWLSAETWCDALLFPRPRLKIKHDFNVGSSGRIVSPPGSPVRRGLEEQPVGNGVAERGIASRVLAHSRSLVDLNQGARDTAADEQSADMRAAPGTSSSQARLLPPQDGVPPPIRTDRPLRPKSWALDDLALPTPVPSLARVLEEGEKLESQRKQWQEQATQSFQNKRTRSVSRARSKSLTQKGRRFDDPRPSNIDFLAARACLGNQLLTPVIAPAKVPDAQIASFASVPSSKSHSHSNSLVKTLSKSSKSHSRGHSRADSWGRSALKMAKTAACGLTGPELGMGSPLYAPDNGLESMLRGGGTKVIRLADPALVVTSDNTPSTSNSPTPSGSAASDARIGIALTTPPLVDNPVDADAMRLSAHPYAQAGLYSYSTFVPAVQPGKEAATEILDHETPPDQDGSKPKPGHILPPDPSSRQHEPRPSVPYHPYAHHSPSSDSYDPDSKLIRRPRADSDIPPPAKMWAQVSPGIIREILPGDIQYSPFMSENGDVSSRNSRIIYDTVGVGETLAFAVRPKTSHDSGLGMSEEHTIVEPDQPQVPSLGGKRSYRQPVQYDATRPPHLSQQEKKHSAPHSAHTFASSPLLYQQTPPLDVPRKYSDEVHVPRTTSTSPESLSPPHSPRSFGNPDDLENFYDLFYRPSHASAHQSIPSEMGTASVNGTPIGLRRTGGSGLTSLARQLSEEFEQLTHEREGSQYSRTSTMDLQGSIGRRPTDSTLEFVFEETTPPESSTTGQSPPSGHSNISPFQPSPVHIPEDVESSRASSPLEPDEDETQLFRVGVVESVSTPPAVASDHRASYMGELSPPENQQAHSDVQEVTALSPHPRTNSGLQPPSADPTRSSYMTTSTGSRISNLSDFPAPPQRHPVGHISLLTSYFDEAHSLSEAHASQNTTATIMPPSHDDADETRDRRLTFSEEDSEIEDLVAALSSHSHSTASHS